jgi:hypothetical protein
MACSAVQYPGRRGGALSWLTEPQHGLDSLRLSQMHARLCCNLRQVYFRTVIPEVAIRATYVAKAKPNLRGPGISAKDFAPVVRVSHTPTIHAYWFGNPLDWRWTCALGCSNLSVVQTCLRSCVLTFYRTKWYRATSVMWYRVKCTEAVQFPDPPVSRQAVRAGNMRSMKRSAVFRSYPLPQLV